MTSRVSVLFVGTLMLLVTSVTSTAYAFPQISSRLSLGVSGRFGDARLDGGPIRLPIASTTDVLFGPRLPDCVRFGATFDLRTQSFRTIEPALLATLAVPTISGFPLTVGAGASWAARLYEPDGVEAVARLGWGYRPINYYVYGYGVAVYADVRRGLTGMQAWSVAGGVEVDLEILVYAPVMFFVNLIRGS